MVTRQEPSLMQDILLSEREKIFSLVKETWRDFEVTEENLDRHKACVVDNEPPCPPQYDEYASETSVQSDMEKSEFYSHPKGHRGAQQKDQPWMTGDLSRCWTLLQSLVKRELAEAIARFSVKSGDERTLSVEVHGDKQRRTSFHKCVRALFPHLASNTKLDAETGSSVVNLSVDKHFANLCEVMPEREASRLLWYFHCGDPALSLDLDVNMHREQRRQLHHALHALFGQKLEAKTLQGCPKRLYLASFPKVVVSQDEKRDVTLDFSDERPSPAVVAKEDANNSKRPSFVQVRFRPRKGGQKRKSYEAASSGNETCLHFVLEKHNLELLDALQMIADAVGCQLRNFTYAGLKDRRALTRQFVTVRDVSPKSLVEVKELLSQKGIFIGSFQWQQKPLQLGQLYANHFTLWLRGCHCRNSSLAEVFKTAVASVKEVGFINAYGPQRFGQGTSGLSHQVGLAMLLGDAEKAVNLLLAPSSEVTKSRIDQAREHFLHTKDAAAAMRHLPANCCKDQLLLRALKRFGCTESGYRSALLALPYASRIFYIQAYTSWLWNAAAAFRIQLSRTVMAGDLVVPRSTFDDDDRLDSGNKTVRVVTEEEQQASRYSLFDVVLPLLGRNCVYPNNEVGEMMRHMLAEDKLSEDCFRVSWLHLNVPGSVRYLIARPNYLEWQTTNTSITQSQTEAETVSTTTGHHSNEDGFSSKSLNGCSAEEIESQKSHTSQGMPSTCNILLKFSLAPSCYATSLLQELTGAGYRLAKPSE